MALPTRGQRDWDDELNNEIQRLDAAVQSAVADASAAKNSAAYSANAAEQSRLAAEVAESTAVAPSAAALASVDSDENSTFRQQQDARHSATYGAIVPAQEARYVEVFDSFFGGVDTVYVEGQRTTATTTTAAAASGATSITVASTTDILPGMWFGHLNTEQLFQVVSVAGATLTITALSAAIPDGATIEPLWTDFVHLTNGGYRLFYRHAVNATRPDGSPVFTDPGSSPVVLLGNSWGVSGGAAFEAEYLAKFPTANLVNVSIGGQTSQELIDRFDTDVPSNAGWVILLEPGVNDMKSNPDVVSHARNLSTLIQKTRALGAIPVHLGPVPLRDWKKVTQRAAEGYYGLVNNDPLTYARAFVPSIIGSTGGQRVRIGVDTHAKSPTALHLTAVGEGAQQNIVTGDDNTGIGYWSQKVLDGGNNNTAVGSRTQSAATGSACINNTAVGLAVQEVMTSGARNTGVGAVAQSSLTTGINNTTIGAFASYALTTGSNNTHIGDGAGYQPNGTTANATTTGSQQTFIGRRSGQASTSQVTSVVAIGDSALVGASLATAIGSQANAGHARSVAIGSTTTTTAADQVQFGPRHVEVTELAADANAPAANGARIYVKDNGSGKTGLYVRFNTGAVQQIALEP